jgi:tetratricopeptide (TPR) repeat protein
MPRSPITIFGILLAVATLLVMGTGCEEVGARRDIQEGNKLYYAGKYDQAIKRYDEALKIQPDLAIGWFNLALSHLALFAPGLKTPENEVHAEGAIKGLERYLKIMPTDKQAQDYLLSTFIDSGRYEGAIDFFKARLEKNPNDIEAIAQLAHISSQAGKFDEAIKWHKKRAEVETATDAKADSWYSIGVLDWRRLNNHPEVEGLERLRIADEGIGWLQKANGVRAGHAATLSYMNLLYRERALASAASYVRVVDTASAQVYYKLASEAAKKQ